MSQKPLGVTNNSFQASPVPGRLADPFLCFGMALALFLVLLGHRPLDDWDEAIYADIAREFVRGTSHLIPFWSFQPWLERTPLFEWLTAGFFALFGVSEFWARAGAALSGASTVLIVFLFAREQNGRIVAWLAAGIVITTPQFFWQSRFGTTDAMLTLWMTLGLYGLYRVTVGRSSGWYWMWIALGLGIMTKSAGPAPLVFSALVVLWLNRQKVRFSRECYIGFALLLAIVIPWHLYMWIHFGNRFLDDYIGRQILARSVKTLEGHTGTPLFYVIRIAKGGFPWSLLLIPAIFRAVRLRRLRVVESYALVVFLFYTVVKTKLPWYITPFYPALALIGAGEITPWLLARVSVRKLQQIATPVFAILSIVILCGDVFHAYDRPEVLMIKSHKLQLVNGPLILCSDDYILDSPAPVFYANRRVLQAYVNQMPRQVENGTPFDPATNDPKFRLPLPLSRLISPEEQNILLSRSLQSQISARYNLKIISTDENYVLGVISPHS